MEIHFHFESWIEEEGCVSNIGLAFDLLCLSLHLPSSPFAHYLWSVKWSFGLRYNADGSVRKELRKFLNFFTASATRRSQLRA